MGDWSLYFLHMYSFKKLIERNTLAYFCQWLADHFKWAINTACPCFLLANSVTCHAVAKDESRFSLVDWHILKSPRDWAWLLRSSFISQEMPFPCIHYSLVLILARNKKSFFLAQELFLFLNFYHSYIDRTVLFLLHINNILLYVRTCDLAEPLRTFSFFASILSLFSQK